MKLITCNDPNNNARFLIDVIESIVYYQNSNYYWLLSDIELIPLFHGDYLGDGGTVSKETAYTFQKKYDNEKISIVNYDELITLLEDTQTVRNGVFVCFKKTILIDNETFRPKVECQKPDKICHVDAELEIRVLDGDLFYVLEKC